METQSLIELTNSFEEMVGKRSSAVISEEGAKRSAGIVINIDEKFIQRADSPIDIFSIVLATSQLLKWCDQENKEVSSGNKRVAGNPVRKSEILDAFEKGDLTKEQIKSLNQELYVVDPLMGATKAMLLLNALHSKYPDVSLKQDIPNSQ